MFVRTNEKWAAWMRRRLASVLMRLAVLIAPGSFVKDHDLAAWRERFPGAPDEWLDLVRRGAPQLIATERRPRSASRAAPSGAAPQEQSTRTMPKDRIRSSFAGFESGPHPVPRFTSKGEHIVRSSEQANPAALLSPTRDSSPSLPASGPAPRSLRARVRFRGALQGGDGPKFIWPSEPGSRAARRTVGPTRFARRPVVRYSSAPTPPESKAEVSSTPTPTAARNSVPASDVPSFAPIAMLPIGASLGAPTVEPPGNLGSLLWVQSRPPLASRERSSGPIDQPREGGAIRRTPTSQAEEGPPILASSEAGAESDAANLWPDLPQRIETHAPLFDADRLQKLVAEQEQRGWSGSRF